MASTPTIPATVTELIGLQAEIRSVQEKTQRIKQSRTVFYGGEICKCLMVKDVGVDQYLFIETSIGNLRVDWNEVQSA
jgi:hypothetical protein